MTLRVVAHITPKPGKGEELKAVLLALIAPTRNEEGCISYELYKDIESGHFTFIEEWTSGAALDEHFETEHIKTALAAFKELAEELDVRKYEVIG